MEELPDAVLVTVMNAGALVVALEMSGVGAAPSLLKVARRATVAALGAGAVSFGAAPLLVLSQRASDAPSGTEVLLFTTSSWGLAVCVLALILARPPRSAAHVAASLLCGVGGLSVLANWERPSSLSPFVRFPVQHLTMLAAGAIFAVGAAVLVRCARTLGAPATASSASAGALLLSLAALVATPSVDTASVSRTADALLVLAVAGALFTIGWVHTASRSGLEWASVSFSLVPVALTGLSFVERGLTVYGPNPILWRPAVTGVALASAGAAMLWKRRRAGDETPGPFAHPLKTGLVRTFVPVAALSLALACAGLFTGGLRAEVTGAFGQEYRAVWTMLGAETAAGWLCLAAAVCAVASASDIVRGLGKTAWACALLAAGAPFAYPLLADTPVRTATRWLPADVQQTLGTEYARMSFEAIDDPVRVASLCLSLLVGVAVIFSLVRTRAVSVAPERTR